MKKLLLVLVLMLLVAGCGVTNTENTQTSAPALYADGATTIFRYVDTEAEIACWIVGNTKGAFGISCLPLSETELDYGTNH